MGRSYPQSEFPRRRTAHIAGHHDGRGSDKISRTRFTLAPILGVICLSIRLPFNGKMSGRCGHLPGCTATAHDRKVGRGRIQRETMNLMQGRT